MWELAALIISTVLILVMVERKRSQHDREKEDK